MFCVKRNFKIILFSILLCFCTVAVSSNVNKLFDGRTDELPAGCVQNGIPANCAQATACSKLSGFYQIQNPEFGTEPFSVYCEAVTDGGNWTVIQLREQTDFLNPALDWTAYEDGFGVLERSYFIGLRKLHAFVKQMGPLELYIELTDNEKGLHFVKYNNFVIGDAVEEYKLKSLGRFSGNTFDSLAGNVGRAFSTKDRNNDWCAKHHGGGWWYTEMNAIGKCSTSIINNYQMSWDFMLVRSARLMIRPRQFTEDYIANEYNKECNLNIQPSNCMEALACRRNSEFHVISQKGFQPYMAQCNADIDGGDWLVIQAHQSEDFNRTWLEYQSGFGDITKGEYFIGLEKLHQFGSQELYVQLMDSYGKMVFTKCDNFMIGNSSVQYEIQNVGLCTGTAGNSLGQHMFQPFTTCDRGRERIIGCEGWWLDGRALGLSNLNRKSKYWGSFNPYVILKSKMMIRPRRYTDQCKVNN